MKYTKIPFINKAPVKEWKSYLIGGKLFYSGSSRLYDSIKSVVIFLSANIISEKDFLSLKEYLEESVSILNDIYEGKYKLKLYPYSQGEDYNGYRCGIFAINAIHSDHEQPICAIYLYELRNTVTFNIPLDDQCFAVDEELGRKRFIW